MLTDFLQLNSDKTEGLVLGTHTARRKPSDYIVSLDAFSFPPREAVKALGVIIAPVIHLKLMCPVSCEQCY